MNTRTNTLSALICLLLALGLVACGDDAPPVTDTGTPTDTSVGDTGGGDTITPMDSGTDSATDTGTGDTGTGDCVGDAECDDGVFCNGAETCNAGTCEAGTVPDCDDSIDCTADSCDEDGAICANVPDDTMCASGETCSMAIGCLASCSDDTECDDGRFCNGAETCDAAGDCVAGTVPDCSDGVACTTDLCDDTVSMCRSFPDDTACPGTETCSATGCIPECAADADCDDGTFCNGAEACVSGSCTTGTVPDCNDSVACTSDVCDNASASCRNFPDDAACGAGETCSAVSGCLAGGCVTDADCDDGVFCNGGETCSAGSCSAGTPVACDDSIACTTDTCDAASDACINRTDDTACSGGNICNGTLGCVECAADTDCSDGVFCNGAERCNPSNRCRDRADPTCDDSISCTVDSCDATADACSNVTDDSMCGAFEACYPGSGCGPECTVNADCQNGSFCDGIESCIAGRCFDRPDPDCNDGVSCTVDSCDETTRGCFNTPNDARCSGTDICSGAMGCIPMCTVNADCDDGLFCNGAEVCAGGSCALGTPPTEDGVSCTFASCNEGTDTIGPQVPFDSVCDDGMACNGVETCDPVLDCQGDLEHTFFRSPTGCAHSFTNISGTGTNYGGCDDCTDVITLGGPGFTLYGVTTSTVEVDSNGSIHFSTAGFSDFSNTCFPSAETSLGTGPVIAPYWDDLDIGNNGSASALHHQYFATCPRAHDRAGAMGCNIFQWSQVEHWSASAPWNMQAILYDGGEEVVFVYDGSTVEGGSNGVIGIQGGPAGPNLSTCRVAGSAPANSSTCIYMAPRACP